MKIGCTPISFKGGDVVTEVAYLADSSDVCLMLFDVLAEDSSTAPVEPIAQLVFGSETAIHLAVELLRAVAEEYDLHEEIDNIVHDRLPTFARIADALGKYAEFTEMYGPGAAVTELRNLRSGHSSVPDHGQ